MSGSHIWRASVVGAFALLSACGAEESAPGTTSAVGTTSTVADATTTTTDATTSTTSTAPTTSVPAVRHFEPECVERLGEATAAPAADDPALAALTVVGGEPALEIGLPLAVADGIDDGGWSPIAGAARIPGGLLVRVGSPSTDWFPGGIVAAVNLDGTVRWVRCLDDGIAGTLVAPPANMPDRALLGTYRYDEGPEYAWDVISLADGRTLETLDDLVAGTSGTSGSAATANRNLVVDQRGVAVFGPPTDHIIDIDADGLLRLDLATLAVSTTTFPPEFDGHPAGELQLEVGSDGSLLRMGEQLDNMTHIPLAVERDGTWITDDAARRAVWGPVVGLVYGGQITVTSWDATGEVLWSTAVRFPGREGFIFDQAGDVAVMVACGPAEGTGTCPDERLIGLDVETGATLWSLPGTRLVGPMADGIAYVTDSFDVNAQEQPAAWFVLDTTTGVVADEPSWQGSGRFSTGCCGDGESNHTGHDGGVVIAVHGGTISVWLPAAATPAGTVRVELLQ